MIHLQDKYEVHTLHYYTKIGRNIFILIRIDVSIFDEVFETI